MPKSEKKQPPEVLRCFILRWQTAPELYPDAVPARDALTGAVERFSRATTDQVAVAMLRELADRIEDTLAEFDRRPAHRPSGARQYDLTELRREMELPEHQSVPPGTRFRNRYTWLADKIHKAYPGKFGQDKDRVRASIGRLEKKIADEEKALTEALKDDGPFTAASLEDFLTGGESQGTS